MLEGVNLFSRSRPAQPAIWDTFGAGVTYLNVTPHGPDPLKTIEKVKAWSE